MHPETVRHRTQRPVNRMVETVDATQVLKAAALEQRRHARSRLVQQCLLVLDQQLLLQDGQHAGERAAVQAAVDALLLLLQQRLHRGHVLRSGLGLKPLAGLAAEEVARAIQEEGLKVVVIEDEVLRGALLAGQLRHAAQPFAHRRHAHPLHHLRRVADHLPVHSVPVALAVDQVEHRATQVVPDRVEHQIVERTQPGGDEAGHAGVGDVGAVQVHEEVVHPPRHHLVVVPTTHKLAHQHLPGLGRQRGLHRLAQIPLVRLVVPLVQLRSVRVRLARQLVQKRVDPRV
mmetsp:Transcript_11182/g.35598  ORF Transcript_11182/g.35598 Transcript_11182/m.35598 type:complete len:288 (-) Transcript_11182:222-1085(-)